MTNIEAIPCQPIPLHYTMPNGVGVIEIDYDGTHLGFLKASGGLKFNGVVYGKSSHNSDDRRIVYRTDKPIAFNL